MSDIKSNSLSQIQTPNDFNKCLLEGQQIEKEFYEDEHIADLFGSTTIITDVSKEPRWRPYGIDQLVHDPNTDQYLKVEIKGGIFTNGKVVVEVLDRIETNHQGWMYKCQADILTWRRTYWHITVKFAAFKVWFFDNYTKPEHAHLFQKFFKPSTWYDRTATSECYCVDINSYEQQELTEGRTIPWLINNTKTKIKDNDDLSGIMQI
jgi:hypothetical protein